MASEQAKYQLIVERYSPVRSSCLLKSRYILLQVYIGILYILLQVTMGSYDGVEICELVGLFIPSKLKGTFGNNIGLYRDDGLVLRDTKSGRLSDKARKDINHAFNKLGLNITAQANQLSTNFLDITLNLSNGTYKP